MRHQSNSSWLARFGRSSLAFILALVYHSSSWCFRRNSPFQGDSLGPMEEPMPPPPPPLMDEPEKPEPEPEPPQNGFHP